jgi:HD-GYP domain-containing protein (c-di-GMP phosphodiesterase class II)
MEAAVVTVDDLVLALGSDARLARHPVKARGQGWVEVELPVGSAVIAWPELWLDREKLAPHLTRARSGYTPLVLLGTDREFDTHRVDTLRQQGELAVLTLPLGIPRLAVVLRNYGELCRLRRGAAEGELLADRYQYELDELISIGRSLSSQRNIDRLLPVILEKSRYVTDADAGSVYVVEGDDEDYHKRTLRFKASQNDSVHLDFSEFTLPVSEKSIVGRCVLSREVINIPDLYALDVKGNNPWGFVHNRGFDEKIGYQTRSMLTVPMIDANNQVIGVIQLINKKRRGEARLQTPEDFDRFVIPFDPRSQSLAATLASQAGISLENTQLYQEIRELFEGFVTASVTAIEQRDPTTSGHSQRVADLTVQLAKNTAREDSGPYREYQTTFDELKQIEYAALLHDFGKVGVRENVLVKAKKLYDADRDLILARFDYVRASIETDSLKQKLALMERNAPREEIVRLDDEVKAKLAEIDEFMTFILKANEPTILAQGGFEKIGEIALRRYVDPRGQEQPYLRPHETETLQILRGSLTQKERLEIESHVSHTYNFLKRIPWGRVFKDIPEYAGSHHEKLDGTGYPRALKSESIPVPAKMMTISDIYDALTASDRPYKKAVPVDKALDIIGSEVKAGKCDADLFRIFVESKVFHVVQPK